MENINEIQKLKKLAEQYEEEFESAKYTEINNDNDSFEKDKLYSFASQTLDEILEILLAEDFDANVEYGDNFKEKIGNAIIQEINKLKLNIS